VGVLTIAGRDRHHIVAQANLMRTRPGGVRGRLRVELFGQGQQSSTVGSSGVDSRRHLAAFSMKYAAFSMCAPLAGRGGVVASYDCNPRRRTTV
jgi:hypothetical protein